jgi:hypothetical protein
VALERNASIAELTIRPIAKAHDAASTLQIILLDMPLKLLMLDDREFSV